MKLQVLTTILLIWSCTNGQTEINQQSNGIPATYLECSDSSCFGTYYGPEFINGDDVAHQFSNKMAAAVGDKLKELYNRGNYSAVDLGDIEMSTENMDGRDDVIYSLSIPLIKVQDSCDAFTSFDHRGGWGHTPKEESILNHFSKVKGLEYQFNKTREGLTEYWLQWKNIDCPNANKQQNVLINEETLSSDTGILISNFSNGQLIYDCYGCETAVSDSIVIYALVSKNKTKVASISFEGNYLDDIKIIILDNYPFLYIQSSHTYGHSDRVLFSIDTSRIKLYEVSVPPCNQNVPDSLEIRKGFHLNIEDGNDINTSFLVRSKSGRYSYIFTQNYELVKTRKSMYKLVPTNSLIENLDSY